MSTYVAFLRGINVGGRIVKMDALRACFEKIGLNDVRTYLQTGNVRFATTGQDIGELRKYIECALSDAFDYDAKIQLVESERLAQDVSEYPFDLNRVDQQNYVIFIEQYLIRAVTELGENSGGEQIRAGRNVIYWQVTKGMTLKSEFAKVLQKSQFREHHTVRNINTLKKILTDL